MAQKVVQDGKHVGSIRRDTARVYGNPQVSKEESSTSARSDYPFAVGLYCFRLVVL
jgi:hypothetical protein